MGRPIDLDDHPRLEAGELNFRLDSCPERSRRSVRESRV
jgi:hypothetical protein